MIIVFLVFFGIVTAVTIALQQRGVEKRNKDITVFDDSHHSMPLPTGLESHPIVQGLHRKLLPFYIHAENVSFLTTPDSFHKELIKLVLGANERIVLMALYWSGNDPHEHSLLEALATRLGQAPKTLHVYVCLDKNRMRRSGQACEDALMRLAKAHPGQVHYLALEIPQRFMGSMGHLAKALQWPQDPRVREMAGVQHIKMYLADNTCMCSGANLSEHYFTTRLDRYVLLRDCPSLADWSMQICECLMKELPWERLRDELIRLTTTAPASATYQKTTVTDTVIYPCPQLGIIDVLYDSATLLYLLRQAQRIPLSSLSVTSAYFNFTDQVLATVLQTPMTSEVRILTPSIECNSFSGGPGFTKWVPHMYHQLCRTFHRLVHNRGRTKSVNLWEWHRAKHTFHAKGLWLQKGPNVTLITMGSSNLGFRSESRDLELNFVMATSNTTLQRRFTDERDSLFAEAVPISGSDHFQRFRPLIALLAECGKSML